MRTVYAVGYTRYHGTDFLDLVLNIFRPPEMLYWQNTKVANAVNTISRKYSKKMWIQNNTIGEGCFKLYTKYNYVLIIMYVITFSASVSASSGKSCRFPSNSCHKSCILGYSVWTSSLIKIVSHFRTMSRMQPFDNNHIKNTIFYFDILLCLVL